MRYTDLFVRITGLCVAVAGVTLAGWGSRLEVSTGRVAVASPSTLTVPEIATVGVGAALAIAGLAVLGGRGRTVAVSVGGAAAVVGLAALVAGIGSSAVVLGVGTVALALLLAGASTGGRAAG